MNQLPLELSPLEITLPVDNQTLRRSTQKKQILPTNTTTKKYPIHRWFNFIAGFSPEFVDSCIAALTGRRQILLDPFSGCATAQVEGLRNGMHVVGYEAHPFFARIANAKLTNLTHGRIDNIERAITYGFNNPAPPECLAENALVYLSKMYSSDRLSCLLGARNRLIEKGLDDLGFLTLSKVFDMVSHSQTDGIYKAPTSRKTSKSPEEALRTVIELLHDDVAEIAGSHLTRTIFNKSSELMVELPSGNIDIVVTSPPYLNNFDFAEMTRHYLYFWGAATTWSEISELVRSKLVVNTTTALKGHRERQQEYKDGIFAGIHEEIDLIVSALNKEKKGRAGKKDYDLLIYPYFFQMSKVLEECLRVLRSGGHFHMMVSDAALYGVHIPAPQILAEIMSNLGFSEVSCTKVRSRGHRWILEKRDGSPVGLGEYHIEARK